MGVLFAVVAALGFAASAVFLQKGVRAGGTARQSMFVSNTATLSIAFIVLAIQWVNGTVPRITPTGALAFALAGVCTALLGRWLEVLSVERVGATYLTAMRMMDPAFSYILAILYLGDSLEWRPALGVLLVIGALNNVAFGQQRRSVAAPGEARLAAAGSTGRTEGVHATTGASRRLFYWGLSLAILASLSYSVGNIMRKAGLNHIPSPAVGVMIATAVAAVIQGVTSLLQPDQRPFTRTTLRTFIWSGLCGGLGTMSYLSALNLVTVPVAVTVRNTSPWFAMMLAPLILKSRTDVSLRLVVSTVLFMAGVILVVSR